VPVVREIRAAPNTSVGESAIRKRQSVFFGEQKKHDSQIERTLSDVTVRRFGDTAILTGILATKSGKENSQEATTVVFLQSSGKWKIASAQWSPVGSTK
jgi:ketosteroid isomerase-like protein